MDEFGELMMTPRGNKNIIEITERLAKLVIVIAFSSTKDIDIAKSFICDWISVYDPPSTVLTDNIPQLTARFLLEVH